MNNCAAISPSAVRITEVLLFLASTGSKASTEALKSVGTASKNYGYRTNDKVCGDRLCSEVQPKESVTKYFGEEYPSIAST